MANRMMARCWVVWLAAIWTPAAVHAGLELVGVTVTPHVSAPRMIHQRSAEDNLSARVDLVLENDSTKPVTIRSVLIDGREPEDWRKSGQWAWHSFPEFPAELVVPAGAKVAWTINGRSSAWGMGGRFPMVVETDSGRSDFEMVLEEPTLWISALTYVTWKQRITPDRLFAHLVNKGRDDWKVADVQVFVPSDRTRWMVFDGSVPVRSVKGLPDDQMLTADDRQIVRVRPVGSYPLTYGLVRVDLSNEAGSERTLWGRTRIKKEEFDISGGWVGSRTAVGHSLTYEPFLKTLKRLHVNAAHIGPTPGYTDQPDLYARYPLKYFGSLTPIEEFDTDETLPRIHAAEFLGEPQYPNPEDQESPQRVYRAMLPYAPTRLPTSVTLSDESTWRFYAGLSDFPHYDAYRVVAPHVDSWLKYDRWEGRRIGWGAPLETIGDMCRSLREMSRPAPTAYWAQGPHDGWVDFDGRTRRSPTADEIRMQAYHALASRITSLYWFNLSPRAIVQYRDTIDELTRIGREIGMLEVIYLTGDAYEYRHQPSKNGFGWDLASIIAPDGALLFALDLEYEADRRKRVFTFPKDRPARFSYRLPRFMEKPASVYRVDADGFRPVPFRLTDDRVTVEDTVSKVGIYLVPSSSVVVEEIEAKRAALIAVEESVRFDPATNDADFRQLERMIQ